MADQPNGMKRYYIATFVTALLTFVASVAASGLFFAYEYGELQHRVSSLETQFTAMKEEHRADWTTARARIERVVERLEAAIATK